MPSATVTLEAVTPRQPHKSDMEREVERLAKLSPEELGEETVRALTRVRDCRASLVAGENELTEVKERVKARKKSLEEAVRDACFHIERRQMAKQLSLGLGG